MVCVRGKGSDVVGPRVQQLAEHTAPLFMSCFVWLRSCGTPCHKNSARTLARSAGGVPPRGEPITENLAASCRATERVVDLLSLCLSTALLISIANSSALAATTLKKVQVQNDNKKK